MNSSYAARFSYNAISVFLSERQRQRIFFVDPAKHTEFLKTFIDADQIPVEYGGTAPALASLGIQPFPPEYE